MIEIIKEWIVDLVNSRIVIKTIDENNKENKYELRYKLTVENGDIKLKKLNTKNKWDLFIEPIINLDDNKWNIITSTEFIKTKDKLEEMKTREIGILSLEKRNRFLIIPTNTDFTIKKVNPIIIDEKFKKENQDLINLSESAISNFIADYIINDIYSKTNRDENILLVNLFSNNNVLETNLKNKKIELVDMSLTPHNLPYIKEKLSEWKGSSNLIYYTDFSSVSDKDTLNDVFNSIPDTSLVVGIASKTSAEKIWKMVNSSLFFKMPFRFKLENNYYENAYIFIGIKDTISDKDRNNKILEISTGVISPETIYKEMKDKIYDNKDNSYIRNIRNKILNCIRYSIQYGKDAVKRLKTIQTEVNEDAKILERYEKELMQDKIKNLLYDKFSIIDRALRDESVFPDIREFSNNRRYSLKTYDEVINSIGLIHTYKEIYPEFYNILKRVTEIKKDKFPLNEEKNVEYTTNKYLGIMKYKYLPKSFKMEDIKQELIELSEKYPINKDKLDFLMKKGDKVVIKEVMISDISGDITIGKTSVISVIDKIGIDIGTIGIPIPEFYKYIEEKGKINLDNYVKETPLNDNIKIKIMQAVSEHLTNIYEFLNLSDKNPIFKRFKEEVQKIYKNDNLSINEKGLKIQILTYKYEDKYFKIQEKIKDYYKLPPIESLLKESINFLNNSFDIQIKGKTLNELVDKISSDYENYKNLIIDSPDMIGNEISKTIFQIVDDKEILDNPEYMENLINAIKDAIYSYYRYEESLIDGVSRLIASTTYNEQIKNALKNGLINVAWNNFKQMFRSVFALLPHQFNESVKFIAKYELTGIKGHLLGWEMRSGKTLTMAMMGYLASVIYKNDSYFFLKNSTMNDILSQIVNHLPMLIFSSIGYKSGDNEVNLINTRNSLTERIYPNIWTIRNVHKVFYSSGLLIDEKLPEYTKDMENLIAISNEKLKENPDIINKLKREENTDYIGILDSDYHNDIKLALYYYIKNLDTEGYMKQDSKEIKKFVESINSKAEKKNNFELKKEIPTEFKLHFVPKYYLRTIPPTIEETEKPLTADGNILANKDIETRIKKIETQKIDNLIYDLLDIPENLTTLKEYDKENFIKEIVDELRYDNDFIALLNIEYETVDEFLQRKYGYRLDSLIRNLINFKEVPVAKVNKEDINLLQIEIERENVLISPKILNYIEDVINESLKSRSYRNELSKILKNDILDSIKPKDIANIFGIKSNKKDTVIYAKFKGGIPVLDKESNSVVLLVPTSKWLDKNNPFITKYKDIEYFSVNLELCGNDKLKIKYHININDDNIPKPFIRVANAGTDMFVHSSFLDIPKNIILDEADESTSMESISYQNAYAIGRNATIRVSATGSPTNGFAENTYALVGAISDLPLKVVKQTIENVRNEFSIYKLSENAVIGGLLFIGAKLFNQSEKESIIKLLLDEEVNINDKLKNLINLYKALNEHYKIPEITLRIESIEEMDVLDLISELNSLIKGIKDVSIKIFDIKETRNIAIIFDKILTNVFFKLHLWDRDTGTYNPIGLVSSFPDEVSVSLQTRANLKSQSNGKEIKEKFNFLDYGYAKGIFEKIKLKGEVPEEEFKLDNKELRYYFDIDLDKYKKDTLIKNIYSIIVSIAYEYIDQINKNPSIFIQNHKLVISEKDLQSILSKTKKTTNDSVLDIIKYKLEYNKNTDLKVSQEKLEIANLIIKDIKNVILSYKDMLKKYYSENKDSTDIKNQKMRIELNGYQLNIKPISLSKLGDDEIDILEVSDNLEITVKDVSGIPKRIEFTKDIEIFKDEWKNILKNPVPIKYNLKLTSDKEHEVIDAATNIGYIEKFKQSIYEGKNFLVASYRQIGQVIDLYNVLSILYEYQSNKENREEFNVIVRCPSTSMKQFFDNINKDELSKLNIKVKVFDNHYELDNESKKLKKEMKDNKNLRVIISSTGGTVARGTDFSFLDELITLGAYQSGSEYWQLLARLFNAKDKHEVDIFTFGKPFAYLPTFTSDNKVKGVKKYISRTMNKTFKLLNKINYINSFLTGEIASILDKTPKDISITKPYKKDFEIYVNMINKNENNNQCKSNIVNNHLLIGSKGFYIKK